MKIVGSRAMTVEEGEARTGVLPTFRSAATNLYYAVQNWRSESGRMDRGAPGRAARAWMRLAYAMEMLRPPISHRAPFDEPPREWASVYEENQRLRQERDSAVKGYAAAQSELAKLKKDGKAACGVSDDGR
jgi:hypothetical protein